MLRNHIFYLTETLCVHRVSCVCVKQRRALTARKRGLPFCMLAARFSFAGPRPAIQLNNTHLHRCRTILQTDNGCASDNSYEHARAHECAIVPNQRTERAP